jgi:uncharacterized Zn finger protein
MSWGSYPPYVSVAERKARAAKQIAKRQKAGQKLEPIGELANRTKIATSFWGRAWCRHIELFSDYESRLPRGRSYLRSGSVLHLAIEPGVITALVSGSEIYELTIRIDTLPSAKWQRIRKRCRGGIGSLIELLRGQISEEIMGIVTDTEDGLFPNPGEIHFNCSCPDWADLCKHCAAVLYGVAARLDTRPELLFTLRGVDHNELIAGAEEMAAPTGRGKSRRIDEASLENVFGIDFETRVREEPPKTKTSKPKAKNTAKAKPAKSPSTKKPRKPAKAPRASKVRKSTRLPKRKTAGKTAPKKQAAPPKKIKKQA